jgi:hypothetical protein
MCAGRRQTAVIAASRGTLAANHFGWFLWGYQPYLAAAVADNGMGSLVGTELNSAKVAGAHANLIEARLSDHITILHGDAMTALNDIRVFPRRAMRTVVFAEPYPRRVR